MASVQVITFLSLYFIALYIHQGAAIQCYKCNSHKNDGCELAIPPKEKLVDCKTENDRGKNYTFCRKITQVIEFSVNNLPPDSRIIRTCGFDDSNYQNSCYQRAGFGGRQEVCACDKDECNSATFQTVSKWSILAGLSAFFVYTLRA